MSKFEVIRNPGSATALMAGVAAGVTALVPGDALAQVAPDRATTAEATTVVVDGEGNPNNTLNAEMGMSRLPGTVQDTPQVVRVVTPELIQQQSITTLEQALRNVPGISASSGEGNGGMNGDMFRIRGFSAGADIYADGLRDIGVYQRDAFNYESVMVLMGTSSTTFGAGTTGGAINTQSKRAFLGDVYDVEGRLGTGILGRGTFDINKQIDATTAIRINGMVHDQDVADRDNVYNDRWGLAASLGVGLGTDTTLYVNYFYQHTDRMPEFGVPFLGLTANSVRRPAPEFGVPRSNFYGKSTDEDLSDMHMFSTFFKKEINENITFNNDTRFSVFDRYTSPTPVTCSQACANAFFNGGNPILGFGGGGGVTYDQNSWAVQNVSTFNAKFQTGIFRHEAIFGMDVLYVDDHRLGYSYKPTKQPGQSIWLPTMRADYLVVPNHQNVKDSWSQDIGLFASDRMWLTEQISILGGVRWDFYESNYTQFATAGNTSTYADADFVSPRASLIWEPTKEQTYYLSYSQAVNLPFGQAITASVNPIGAATRDLNPETSETFEGGAKISLLNGKLGLTGAVFQTTKSNSYYQDASGNLVATGEKQRVRGVELGVTGNVTDAWVLNFAYTYLDSEIVDAANRALIGNPVAGVPKNAASLWTTYEISTLFPMRGKLLAGGGVTYRDAVYVRSDMLAEVPYSFSLDAIISYEYENYRIALNAFNLTDRINYDTFFQGSNQFAARAVPSSGRTFVVTAGAKF